jgi:hypothetical protein
VRRRKLRRAATFNDGGITPVVIDECEKVLQLEGNKEVRRGRFIEKNRSSGRRSLTKADDGAVRAKSHAGRSPPITGGG